MRINPTITMLLAAMMTLFLLQACGKKKTEETAEAVSAEVEKKEGKPRIEAPEKLFNFGKVKEGDVVEHAYKILNKGDADLVIENVRSSCGCTVAALSEKTVPPGGETEIKATFRTQGRSGKNRKTITITSNDPVTPRLMLSIEGEIETDVMVVPRSLWLGQLKKGERGEKEFSVKVSDPEQIKITSLSVEDKLFAVKRKSGDAKGDAQYELVFKGSRKLGPISTRLQVEYEGGKRSPVRVPVRVEVVGDLQYTKYLRFIKRNGAFSPMSAVFKSRSGKPVVVKSAKDPQNLLKLTIVEAKGPRAIVRAEVADPEASFQRPKRGNIVVKTGHRDQPSVDIGYTISEPRIRPGFPGAGPRRPGAAPPRPGPLPPRPGAPPRPPRPGAMPRPPAPAPAK